MNAKTFYSSVYDLLIEYGAYPSHKDSFVEDHTGEGCSEWRFMGVLGYGGKYRQLRNEVDCYPEDETPERKEIVKEINAKLALLKEAAQI